MARQGIPRTSGETRNRYLPRVGAVGGGPGVCPTVVVAWGPTFGEAEELPIGVSASLGGAALDATQPVGQTASVPVIALDGTRTLGHAPSIPSLALDGQRTLGLQASVPLLGFDAVRTVGHSGPTFPALALAGVRTLGVRPSIPSLALDGVRRVGSDFSEIVYDIPSLLASQDSWVPEVTACPDNANKNATVLQIEGTTGAKKDTYIEFDTSALVAPGQTCVVNSASLTVYVTTAPIVASNLISDTLDTAAFNEATATCSTMPPSALDAVWAPNLSISTTGDKTLVAGTAGRQALRDHLNNQQRILFLLTTTDVIGNNFRLQSKDSGGSPGNASGPRLAINFSILNP